MGMFDYIKYKGQLYQTKSLDCTLTSYAIEDDGWLYREQYGIKPIESERGFPAFEQVDKHWVMWPYSGAILFHDYDKETDTYIELQALVEDGRILWVREYNFE